METKYPCPCCGFLTLSEQPPGTYDICPVCNWEDDNVQYEDTDFEGGANKVSLNQARKNFSKFGASDVRFKDMVRPPNNEERP
ncbi:MAG: CPCC family cysteine-rich protein [Patescibacteria group bacterium]|nr:CPCC family cysteine-rich protein [Patescibacteria group bacterium]